MAQELPYAKAFADALVDDDAFRRWVISETKFKTLADAASPLHREMLAKRSPGTKYWWRHNYQERSRCSCVGCRGRETDIFAVFRVQDELDFALHIEVKYPGDTFHEGQATAYNARAKCWISKAPERVLQHQDAVTAVLFSEGDRWRFASDVVQFDTQFTFEAIETRFPNAVPQG